MQTAVSNLGNDLATLGTTLADEAAHNFKLLLLSNSQVGQPQTPTAYPIVIQNTGSQTTTYDLSINGVPSGVTAAFSQSSVTLAPGQATSVIGGVTNLNVTITSNSTTELAPFNFTVQVTAEGASEISRTATGAFTARQEFVSVVSVDTSPPFTDPGGQVTVSARVLNAVNQQQQAQVSYVVKDPNGQTVFTSQPVTTTLGVLTTLTTVNLGTLDTTNFARGEYTIAVSVTSPNGQPIPGGTGQGSLLVGSPVTASMSITPTTAPAGDSTVTDTLQIDSHINASSPLSLVGQVQTSGGGQGLALMGTLAYVGGPNGISIVDVSKPASPTVVKTFGSDVIPSGSVVNDAVEGDQLIVTVGHAAPFSFLIYSLADPLNPQLLGQNSFNYFYPVGLVVQNSHAFVPLESIMYTTFFGDIIDQHGDLLSIDISNPATPTLTGALFTQPPNSQPFGGNYNVWQVAAADDQTLLVDSTTATGGDALNGVGRVLVVSTTDPNHPTLLSEVDIPGTVQVTGIAKEGNLALVLGSSGGRENGDFAWTGHLVLATLDLTVPSNPKLIATQDLSQASSNGESSLLSLGNGMFASRISGTATQTSALMLINAKDPHNLVVSQIQVPTDVTPVAVAGNLLYTTGPSGVLIFDLGAVVGTPVTAQVTVPKNTATCRARSPPHPPRSSAAPIPIPWSGT